MRLATRRNDTRDGELVVVAADGRLAAPATGIAPTLQTALDDWATVGPQLLALADAVEAGTAPGLAILLPEQVAAPLPRAWSWLDGSAYPQHAVLMQQAFGLPALPFDRPLMYQGLSDRFLGPLDDVALPSEEDGIDFEGEFGVIVDDVPMGIAPTAALDRIRLIVQINDWSLRTLAPIEMKTGFGWVQAKPACSLAPFAVTPDALGDRWRDGRVSGVLDIRVNDAAFGRAESGAEMAFGFHDLIAHAARTRTLPAGTIIGSGTVSNAAYRDVGSSCLSERRAIDVLEGRPMTPFLHFGDRVRMEALVGGEPLFGIIDQRVVAAG